MPAGAIRAILFDFDGVVVDSEPLRFQAGREVLAAFGVPLAWADFTRMWLGRTDEAGLRGLLGPRFATDGPAVIARRNAAYEARLPQVPLFPDALRLLDRLPPTLRLAIVSGSRRLEVASVLTRAGLASRFSAVVAAGDYARAKPAPDPFLAAARRLGVPPTACLVIEDAPAGVAAARAAGMRVVAVDRGRGAEGLGAAAWTIPGLDALAVTPEGEVQIRGERPAAGPSGR